jgi:hypothetical protein
MLIAGVPVKGVKPEWAVDSGGLQGADHAPC